MASKPIHTIRINSHMSLNELENAKNTIKKFDHKYELRASKTPIAESLGKAFVIYKKTFSERSFGKLNTLKNYVLHKNLSNNEFLTKNIFDRNSISVKDLKRFLTERIKLESHSKVYKENNLISTEKKSFNEETNINLENNAQTQKNNPTDLKENASLNELMELVNELGLEGITLNYLKSATNIKTESHKNNQKEVKSTIQDDDLMKMLDDLQGHGKADELDAILNEFKENSPDDEMDAILNEFKKDSPHNKLDAILNELNTNSPDGDLDKNLEDLKILIAPTQDPQPEITKNDIELPPPTDDIGSPPPNYKPDPPSIKQIHIANLEKAIDLGQIQFDTTKPNYKQLNRQKEIVETTIKLIASASTLRKSERIDEGRGSLSNLKLQLKREFQTLMIMANNNGYQPENWIKRTVDLDSALRLIDLPQEKKSSWF